MINVHKIHNRWHNEGISTIHSNNHYISVIISIIFSIFSNIYNISIYQLRNTNNLWLCSLLWCVVCLERKCFKFLQSHFNLFPLTKNHATNVYFTNCKFEMRPLHLCICQQWASGWGLKKRVPAFPLVEVVLRCAGKFRIYYGDPVSQS